MKFLVKFFIILLIITTESLAYIIAGMESLIKRWKPLQGNNWSSQLHISPPYSFLSETSRERLKVLMSLMRIIKLGRKWPSPERLFKGVYYPRNCTEATWTLPGFYWQTPAACWFEQLLKINQTLPFLRQAVIGGGYLTANTHSWFLTRSPYHTFLFDLIVGPDLWGTWQICGRAVGRQALIEGGLQDVRRSCRRRLLVNSRPHYHSAPSFAPQWRLCECRAWQKSAVSLPTWRFGAANPEGLGTARRMHTRVSRVDPRCSCVFRRKSAQHHKCRVKTDTVPLGAAGCIPAVTFSSRYDTAAEIPS